MHAHFGNMADGQPVERLAISSSTLRVSLLSLGAAVQDVRLAGVPWPLTLGADRLAPYLCAMQSFGVIMGPVANRISNGQVVIRGVTHQVPLHDGPFSLHSGPEGVQARVWQVDALEVDRATLSLDLPDGACGLPGQRRLEARFSVTDSTLRLELCASSDARTPINLANHSYWNLDGTGDVRGHGLRVAAETVLETDAAILPTGRLSPVGGSYLDHRELRTFAPSETQRYDNSYCLSERRRGLSEVAELRGAKGVWMQLSTTEPGLQVYDAGGIDSGAHIGLTGQPYRPFCGVALEAQGWPDATSQPGFPSVWLDPGEEYRQVTEWQFGRSDT